MKEVFNKISKYNFWDAKLPSLGYVRRTYLEKIAEYIDNKLVKVLVGQRRVGKSYILRQIINLLIEERKINPKNIFYVNP